MSEFFIVDLRRDWKRNPYVTVWRPDDAGYAYPLPWAGRYSTERIKSNPTYYIARHGRSLTRFPIPADLAFVLGVEPTVGHIDGNAGPVIRNDGKTRAFLRRHAVTYFAESRP